MRSAPLVAEGLLLAGGPFGASTVAALAAEAAARRAHARRQEFAADAAAPTRGGSPARCFGQADGGPAQSACAHAPALLAWLGTLCGATVRASGEGTFSYYERPGDHIALHRDVIECDLTVLTVLEDDGRGSGGWLWAWPARRHEPLGALRRAPSAGAVCVRPRPGQSIVMLGGAVPHCVSPLEAGQSRVVSVLCFRAPGLIGAPGVEAGG